MSGDIFTRGKILAISFSLILPASICFGLAMTENRGSWPADWPKELEPYRQQAKTIGVAAGNQEDVFKISFKNREQFEKIWSVILTLKSDGAALTLVSAGSHVGWGGLFDNNEPIVRIYAPSYTSGHIKFPNGKFFPLKPQPPWPASAYLPNGFLPKYVRVSNDKTTWVPADANHGTFKGFEYRASIEVELVVDGKIIDLNRIRLPADTFIIDKRNFNKSQK